VIICGPHELRDAGRHPYPFLTQQGVDQLVQVQRVAAGLPGGAAQPWSRCGRDQPPDHVHRLAGGQRSQRGDHRVRPGEAVA